jgi:hypothetical protein
MPEYPSETDESSNGFDLGSLLEKRSERVSERLYFYPLPNYHQDRRFDPRARGELSGMLPNSEDYAAKIKKIMPPGWYAVELRRGSKIAESWALEIKPDERRIDADALAAPAAPVLTVEAVAKVVTDALERQRAEFAQTVTSLREELRPQVAAPAQPAPSLTDELRKAVSLVAELRNLTGEVSSPPSKSGETQRSPEEELTLAIATKSDLLPTVIESIAGALAMANGGAAKEQSWLDKTTSVFSRSPMLQQRVVNTWDRVLNRFLPADSDSDEDDVDAEQRRSNLLDYLIEKCAADEPVSLGDDEIVSYAESDPNEWAELTASLTRSSIDEIVAFIGMFKSSYALVLRAEHAPIWIKKNLIEPAKALRTNNQIS